MLMRLRVQNPGTALDVTWRDIIKHAEVRLETLLRLYYLRHSFESYDPLLMHWLMFLGDTVLQRLDSTSARLMSRSDVESMRSTLILCAKGLYDQGHNYHIAVLVYRLLRDRMKANDLDLLRTHIFSSSPGGGGSGYGSGAGSDAGADDDPPLMMEYVQAEWVAPIGSSNDPARKTLDYLLAEYEKLSLDRNVEDLGEISSSASPGP